MTRYSRQTRMLVAVDCIIFGFDGQDMKLLLIQRAFEPEKGKWSLMGGFVQPDEGFEEAAARTLKVLTGLEGVYMEQLMAFDRRDSARYYDIWPVCVVSEECNIADALLETKGPSAARKSLEGAAGRMRVSGVKNDDLWALWYFSMGKVELRAGNRFAAERNFRQIDPLYISRRTIDKERTKGGVQ